MDVAAAEHANADEVVDCQGLHLLPGVIDDQVHFREPGLTHKEDLATASHACAAGGTTSFLEMPNTKPPAVTIEGVRDKERLAATKALVNYGFYIGATPDNAEELSRATDMPGIKIFIGSSTGNLFGRPTRRARENFRANDATDLRPLRRRNNGSQKCRTIGRHIRHRGPLPYSR